MSDDFGNAKTNQFQINTYENDDQSRPHIARFADGTIVATWLSGRYGTSEGQDGDNFEYMVKYLTEMVNVLALNFR